MSGRGAVRVSPTALTHAQFLELVNNTPLGVVCSPRQLKRMREAAGSRIGRDGKLSLPAVAAWLRKRLEERRAKTALKSTDAIAEAPEILRHLTIDQLAKLLGVNPRVARRWRDEQGLPCKAGDDEYGGDRFDLVDVCAWFAHRKGMKAIPKEGEEDLETAKIKKLEQEILNLQLRNGKLSGETVPAQDVGTLSDAVGMAFSILSGRFEAMLRGHGEAALDAGQQALEEARKKINESWGTLRIAWQAASMEHGLAAGVVSEEGTGGSDANMAEGES